MSCLQPKQKIGISTLPPDPHPHPPNCWEVVQVWTGQKRMFRGYPKKGTCITAFIFHIYYTWNHFMPSWMMKVSLKSPHRSCPKHRFVSGSFDDNFVYFQDYKIKDKTAALMIMREEREQSHREEMTEEFKLYILFFISSTVPVLSRKNRSEHSMLLKRPSMTISSTYST